jgi:DNA repair protein RadA
MESLGAISIEVAERLERAGLKSLKALAATPPAFIAEVAEIPFDKAYEICRRAWLSGGSTFITALELLERRRSASSLTTGCRALDELLGGGVEAKAITEVCGEYGSGKTQLCHQLCVTAQLPPSRGGLSASALYIDTEGTFRPERLIAIAERFNLPPQQVLENVMYARAYSSDHQAFLVDEACKVIEERKVGVVVVDSLVGHFRGELCGRELLVERQQRLNRHVHQLLRVAEVFNVAVVVTNQVLSVPEPSFPSSFMPQRPVGGHVVAHGCTHRIWLRRLRGCRRVARLFDSPSRPEAEAFFKISSDGIKDLEPSEDSTSELQAA